MTELVDHHAEEVGDREAAEDTAAIQKGDGLTQTIMIIENVQGRNWAGSNSSGLLTAFSSTGEVGIGLAVKPFGTQTRSPGFELQEGATTSPGNPAVD